MPSWSQRRPSSGGFSLIELLVVAAVIALLLAVLLPALARARLQAKIVRARGELYQIAVGLTAYHDDWEAYPLAAEYCAAGGAEAENYNHLPPVLQERRYLSFRPEDIFNPGKTYKYAKPGIGWGNGALSWLGVWVPKDFPHDARDSDPADDLCYWDERTSPVKFAVWSVGPAGPKDAIESSRLHYPVPKRTWYWSANGPYSEGVITIIRAKQGFIQSEP